MFEHESGHWILPYLSTAEQQDFKDLVQQTQREAVQAQIKECEKIKIHRVRNVTELQPAVQAIRDAGRTPVLISTNENPIEINEIQVTMNESQEALDLRMLVSQIADRSQWYTFRINQRQQYLEQIAMGEPAVCHMIVDESAHQEHWEHHYDPDLLCFIFGRGGIPMEAWRGNQIFSRDAVTHQMPACVVDALAMSTEQAMMEMEPEEGDERTEEEIFEAMMEARLHESRERCLNQLAVFSKTKFSQELSDDELLKAFVTRFERTLPLNMCDCLLVESLAVPEERPSTHPSQVEAEVASK
jgi:hypothetical protein